MFLAGDTLYAKKKRIIKNMEQTAMNKKCVRKRKEKYNKEREKIQMKKKKTVDKRKWKMK